MWKVDLLASKFYAIGLSECGILTKDEAATIGKGLDSVGKEWESGTFAVKESDEDIHTANERRLSEIIGSLGGKLHTGRSRNDQVAVDVRMWLRDEIDVLSKELLGLIHTAAERASAEISILMPGYTHLQRAQPVRWSHWILAHAFSWKRDLARLQDLRRRVDECPLGSGALSGHPFNLDRQTLSSNLGFAHPTGNSMDSVADRDYILEFLSFGTICGVHLSRFAEDLIIYSSAEFNFVKCSDAYSTGSSLMPQKKNPDALELLRGKTGRLLGNFVQLSTTMKGIPMTYNKDMQEDKDALFDTVDTMHATVAISRGVLSTLTPNSESMFKALSADMLATDLADYLVRRGVPFRETHHISGECVKLAEDTGVQLSDLTLQQLQGVHKSFEADVLEIWDFERSTEMRNSIGGTSKRAVEEQIENLMALKI